MKFVTPSVKKLKTKKDTFVLDEFGPLLQVVFIIGLHYKSLQSNTRDVTLYTLINRINRGMAFYQASACLRLTFQPTADLWPDLVA